MPKRLPNIISPGWAKILNDEVRRPGVLPLREEERFWLAKAAKVGPRQVDLWLSRGKIRRPLISSRPPSKITGRNLFALEPHLRVRALLALGIWGNIQQTPDKGYDPKTYIERRINLWDMYDLIEQYVYGRYPNKYLRDHWFRLKLSHNPHLIDPVTKLVTGGWELEVSFYHRYPGDSGERRAARARERRREREARKRERGGGRPGTVVKLRPR